MFACKLIVQYVFVPLYHFPWSFVHDNCVFPTISQDFTVPSLKFDTGSGYTRQIDEQPHEQNQDLEGYQIDESRAWDTRYALNAYTCIYN